MNTKSCNASSSVDFVGALENGEVSTTKSQYACARGSGFWGLQELNRVSL